MAFVDSSRIAISGNRGRYRGAARAPAPPGGLPKPRRAPGLDVGTAAVVDPWGNGRDRIQVHVNRRGDVLEMELAAGRISEAAYEVGRSIQAAVERMGGVKGSNWAGGSRIDAESAAELMLVHTLDNVRAATRLMDAVGRAIGTVGARFLRTILCEGLSFTRAAELRGRTSQNAGTHAGERFRDLLEDLAKEWGAKGKACAQIIAGFGERPEEVTLEPTERPARAPMVRGRSDTTAALGRQALDRTAGSAPAARSVAVRRGLKPS